MGTYELETRQNSFEMLTNQAYPIQVDERAGAHTIQKLVLELVLPNQGLAT